MPNITIPVTDRVMLINFCFDDAQRWDIIATSPKVHKVSQQAAEEFAAASRSLMTRLAESIAADDISTMNRHFDGEEPVSIDSEISVSIEELIALQLMCYRDAKCWHIRAANIGDLFMSEATTALAFAEHRRELAKKLDQFMAPSIFTPTPFKGKENEQAPSLSDPL